MTCSTEKTDGTTNVFLFFLSVGENQDSEQHPENEETKFDLVIALSTGFFSLLEMSSVSKTYMLSQIKEI